MTDNEKVRRMLKEEEEKLLQEINGTIQKKKKLSDPDSENELLKK